MKNFDTLLESSAAVHGHLCPGQVVGVRMAMLGCRLIDLDEPTRIDQIKKLIVFVEMDRCAGDAVAFVTGAKLGRRSLKFRDYGIMAATFVNLGGNTAFRVISTEEARELASLYAPAIPEKYPQQLEAYKRMSDSAMFRVQKVRVDISECDLPGPTRKKVSCSRCGQVVRDNREIVQNGHIFCKPCAQGAYFYEAEEITLSHMNYIPSQKAQQTLVVNKIKK